VRMVRRGPEDAELSHGRRGAEGTAARAVPGRQPPPPPPAIAPAATASTSTSTPTSPPPQQEVHRAKTVIGPVHNPDHHVTWPHNRTRLAFAQSPPLISTKAGWLMSAVIVANETPSKAKPWWHHHSGLAEIALPVASHPSAGTTSRRVTRHQRICFRYSFGPLGVYRIPFASFSSRSIHLSTTTTTTLTHPLFGGHLISFPLAFVGSGKANFTCIAGLLLLPSLIGLHLASILVVCCMIPP
jgi:hypothetical protein